MNLEKIVDSQGVELNELKKNISEISTDLQLLLKDHKYLSDKVDDINTNLNSILYSQEKLSHSVIEFSNFMSKSVNWRAWFDRNWWKIMTSIAASVSVLWAIMDFLYKLDPPK